MQKQAAPLPAPSSFLPRTRTSIPTLASLWKRQENRNKQERHSLKRNLCARAKAKLPRQARTDRSRSVERFEISATDSLYSAPRNPYILSIAFCRITSCEAC